MDVSKHVSTHVTLPSALIFPSAAQVGLILSSDDYEVLDGLKQNAGKKKQCGFYAAIVNLETDKRFARKNMCPLTMVNSKVVEKQDLLRVCT